MHSHTKKIENPDCMQASLTFPDTCSNFVLTGERSSSEKSAAFCAGARFVQGHGRLLKHARLRIIIILLIGAIY